MRVGVPADCRDSVDGAGARRPVGAALGYTAF